MANEIPPKRTESAEYTIVIPRDALPPVSTVGGPTIEQLADIERAQRDLEETLVPCPACASCAHCRGQHMVTHERRQAWLAEHEPVPPSRPEAA